MKEAVEQSRGLKLPPMTAPANKNVKIQVDDISICSFTFPNEESAYFVEPNDVPRD